MLEVRLTCRLQFLFDLFQKQQPGRGTQKKGRGPRPNGVSGLRRVPFPVCCACVCVRGVELAATGPVARRNFRFHLLCTYPVKRYKFTGFYFIFSQTE